MVLFEQRSGGKLNTYPIAVLMVVLVGCVQVAAGAAPLPAIEHASWIWGDMQEDTSEFRYVVTLEQAPAAASVLITADNGYELYVNGTLVGYDIGPESEVWGTLEHWDIMEWLQPGKNVLGIRGICLGGSRGVIAAVRIDTGDGELLERTTDAAWRTASAGEPAEYAVPEYEESEQWRPATVLGQMGMAPWGRLEYTGSQGGRRRGVLPTLVHADDPDDAFDWPGAVAFLADDCSVYEPLNKDAWGICFRIEDWSRAYTMFDLPSPSKIGRTLHVLDSSGADAEPRLLFDAGAGVIGSPSVSYDGRHVYMALAPEGEAFFHIYRLAVDGGAPEQLTDGPYHDIDPVELPDGRIVFSSTRIGTFEEYHGAPSRALFVMQPDGSGIQSITHTPIFDNEPKVLADGRIAFVRSDNFFGRAKVETQIHAIRPDGAAGITLFGSDVGAVYGVRLRMLGYGSPAPLPDGRVAVLSKTGNFIAEPGTPREQKQKLPSGLGDLAPLPDGRLLVTVFHRDRADRRPRVLAVFDPADNKIRPIYESPDTPIHSPVFVGPRPRPPVLPGAVNLDETASPDATGFLYAQNVRITRKTDAGWGHVRGIRVLRSRGVSLRSSHWDFVHQGKEVTDLGTVPIGPDGSFAVEVPADVPLAFQAVDAEGRSELNEMSWIYVRPGEVRSCTGCHDSHQAAPPVETGYTGAFNAKPVRLLDQGPLHRWRGNNSGVSGMMDLQFERLRETASLNRYRDTGATLLPGYEEPRAWMENLGHADAATRIAAANRLALFRDPAAAWALADMLDDSNREARLAAAMALAACGASESIPRLVKLLEDPDVTVALAAEIALESITAHQEPLEGGGTTADRQRQAAAWHAWLDATPWRQQETALIEDITSPCRVTQRQAIKALGRIGGDAAREALRAYVAKEKHNNPYPPFVNNNRTDHFTFDDASPLNPRTLQAAVRSLGLLNDREAIPLFRRILAEHTEPRTGNLFLAEAVVEALGFIDAPEVEELLIDTFSRLGCYADYVGWYSDHPALYACHSSPIHARVIEALDRIGATGAAAIVPHIIRSIPTDPDRALFLETDTYELLAGRVIRRSGRGHEVIAACLAMLGDPNETVGEPLQAAISDTVNAWAGHPCPENRAAQLLASLCREPRYAPAVRAAYERYLAKPEELFAREINNPTTFNVALPTRHWVLFFLGRALGNLQDPDSVDMLLASLAPELHEARHGRPAPDNPNIHLLQMEATPCWRAAAAWALGHIGERRAVPVLLDTVANLDNAVDTRYAAAEALVRLADADDRTAIRALAEDYPEVSVRRKLLEARP